MSECSGNIYLNMSGGVNGALFIRGGKDQVSIGMVKSLKKTILLFIFCIFFSSCIGPVPVDVVMIDNELVFVLEEEREIDFVLVTEVTAHKPTDGKSYAKTMWVLAHNLTTEVKKRKYPRLKQIKYGQKFEEFPRVEGPFPLQRNVEYSVKINMGNKFASEVFIITSDNKVIMPRKVKGRSAE